MTPEERAGAFNSLAVWRHLSPDAQIAIASMALAQIRAAVEAERERCAKVAEAYLTEGLCFDPKGISLEIAAAILEA